MASTTVDPRGRRVGARSVLFALAVAVPLSIVALAYGLWWISDRLLYIGPLDRAAFGWAVVIPIWVSAPIISGFIWRQLTPRGSATAAVIVATAISAVAAVLFWLAVAYPGCETGAVRTPIDWVLPSLSVGVAMGGGLAASGLLAAALVRAGHPWRAVFLGAAVELALVFAAILVAAIALIGPGCQRPTL